MTATRVLDDLAKMAGGTMSLASSVRGGIKDEIKSRVEDITDRLDLVPRSEFEDALSMIKEARMQQTALEKRINALEKQLKSKSKK